MEAVREPTREADERSPADELGLVVPAPWRKVLHPRRGGTPVPVEFAAAQVAAAVQECLAAHDWPLREIIGNPVSEPSLAVAALPWLDSARRRDWIRLGDEITPAGAAAVVTAVCHLLGDRRRLDARTVAFADLWVAVHGLGFAACAAAELFSMDVGFRGDQPHWYPLVRLGPNTQAAPRFLPWLLVARRVRAHLAAAGDDEYARVTTLLASYREHGPGPRAMTSYLLPTQADWVADDCHAAAAASAETTALLLLMAVGSTAQVDQIGHLVLAQRAFDLSGVIESLVEGVGPGVSTFLDRWIDGPLDTDQRRRLLSVLATLPTDDAFTGLLRRLEDKQTQPAVLAAMKRFPVRALRLLPAAAGGSGPAARLADELLRTHLSANAELVAAALPLLPPAAAARVAARTAEPPGTAAPDAAPGMLPKVLVTPPWTGPRRRPKQVPKQVVTDGLTVPAEVAIVWRPGEREAWFAATERYTIAWGNAGDWSWPRRLQALRDGTLHGYQQLAVFTEGPEDLVRPELRRWRPADRGVEARLAWLIARFGLDALPLALHLGAQRPAANAARLLPYAAAEVAAMMADWLLRLRSVRADALAWFARHPATAAAALVPAALGPAGARRRAAENALRAIARGGHAAEVATAARRHGGEVAEAIEALLSADPLDLLPSRIPVVPDWADPVLLPQVMLRDRIHALPATAVRHLCTMLALSKPGEPYAGITAVREAADPESLAAFGWALFERWRSVGAPAKDAWALDALGCVGDDGTVRRLAPLVRAWPGEGGHTRATRALDVFTGIGTEVALTHLHGISQRAAFRALRARAAEKIAQLAADLDLSTEQLADRLVPDLGLDAAGGMTFDYGRRRFTVGFDERLRPHVDDDDGVRRRDLPKPGRRDDAEQALAAYKRFATLKKDARTLGAAQLRRLEDALVAQRRWTVDEFRTLFVAHPLLGHLARRLVWLVDTPHDPDASGTSGTSGTSDGGPGRAFRIAGDGTCTDVEDNPFSLPAPPGTRAAGVIRLAHPLHLGETVAAWSALFAGLRILQPFPQLSREVFTLTDAERDATALLRLDGLPVPTLDLLRLEHRGWRRGVPIEGGVQGWLERDLPGGRSALLHLDPGIVVGNLQEFPLQQVEEIRLSNAPTGGWPTSAEIRFGVLDPVVASEILRDLHDLPTLAPLPPPPQEGQGR